jgi:hypothetical protein
MIGISTITFDLDGAFIFCNIHEDIKNRAAARRISRTATLDGGAVITDGGYSDGDRTITIKQKNCAKEDVDFAKYIIENYALVVLTTEDGVFTAAPESYNVDYEVLSIKLLIKSKIS